ncbi:NUDIX domain-containing protein [Devriesea agamarum]|uniref:NUDIX domain-containing protein n=1 Tax=Devriesea agamarum TaxID=472569 RepID=UPI000A056C42|nr:NUDIX hydrolase [Devriesea agamarum]
MNLLLPDPVYFASLPKVITSGAALIRDEKDRVLIVKPNYRTHWLLPGGCLDEGEDARQCARREVREELGLDVEVGRLLVVTWVPASPARGAPMGVHFVFDGGVLPAAEIAQKIVLQQSELDAWDLVDPQDAACLSDWGVARVQRAVRVARGEEAADLDGLMGMPG